MDAAGLAPGTIKTRYVNVRSVFRAARQGPGHRHRPDRRGRVSPAAASAEAAMSIPAPEEVGLLLAVRRRPGSERSSRSAPSPAYALGEAAAVQIGDINFLRKSLTVTRQVQRVNGGDDRRSGPRSTAPSASSISPTSLVDLLAQHVAAFGDDGPQQWLFAGEGDDPPHQNTVGYWWRKTLRDAGLSGIKLHDLRHFYASGLIAAGCDVVTVQRSLGHSKATTTLNTYAHLWPTAEDRTRKAAESIMVASLGRADHPRSPTPTELPQEPCARSATLSSIQAGSRRVRPLRAPRCDRHRQDRRPCRETA